MINHEEAIERAEQDHGDDDDVVWMKQNSRGHIYHDDPECSYLSVDTIVEFTRRQAQNREYGPCKACTLETADTSKTGTLPTDLIETVRQKMIKE
jgi:hypothetical protein